MCVRRRHCGNPFFHFSLTRVRARVCHVSKARKKEKKRGRKGLIKRERENRWLNPWLILDFFFDPANCEKERYLITYKKVGNNKNKQRGGEAVETNAWGVVELREGGSMRSDTYRDPPACVCTWRVHLLFEYIYSFLMTRSFYSISWIELKKWVLWCTPAAYYYV